MDNDLDRSVRLLEDALSNPGRGLFKTSFGIKRRDLDKINLSMTLDPNELTKVLGNAGGYSIYDDTMKSLLHEDKTVTGTVIQTNTPWRTAVDSLYVEFFEVLQGHSGGHDALEVVSDLARCCSDALKVVQGLKSKVAVEEVEEEIWLERERNTWRLLFILYQDRLLSPNMMEDDAVVQYFGHSEKCCVQSLFKRDCLVRESQLVIDWLEANANDRQRQHMQFSDKTVGWENTLHQLQSPETIAFSSSKQLVTQLDPDAPYYLNKPLHDIDVNDHKRLAQRVFDEIRCGKLNEAEKLAYQCGHCWQAALFQGWRLYHNPNLREQDDTEDSETDKGFEEMPQEEFDEVEGNRCRDIWKIMAMKYCKAMYLDCYERAAVGAFCGYSEAILPVCRTWEDSLWAYMKTMVDIRVESEIRDCCMKEDSYMPLPDEYWAQRISLNQVFTNLESCKRQSVGEESLMPEHVIQKYIILDEVPKLLSQLEDWVEDPLVNTHFLRFIAHVVLFLDQVGQGHGINSVERVLEAYIKRLMDMNETQLVAFYVSKLRPSNQVSLYASYLENITDNEQRKESLIFADDCGLDIFAVTKQVVENIRNFRNDFEGAGNLQHKITETDKFMISGLDWLIFYENQRAEALVQTNALIFTFLALGKLDAAQLAFNKIPTDCVEKILSEDDVGREINQAIKEHLSYKAYLDAQEAFSEWFQQSKNKPLPPDDLPENAQFPEKVAHQHRVSQFKAETERWKLTTAHLAKSAKTLLYNVLLFPEGWLIGAKDADYLRSTCIPEVVLLLYSVLFESGLHDECIQLADVIATEKNALYRVYSKEKLGEILIKLCESSVALLNAKKDPWGNETSAQ